MRSVIEIRDSQESGMDGGVENEVSKSQNQRVTQIKMSGGDGVNEVMGAARDEVRKTDIGVRDVKETVGAKGKSCNIIINKLFMADFMSSFHQGIPDLLHDGLEVLIYAGDVDYICNWQGGKNG